MPRAVDCSSRAMLDFQTLLCLLPHSSNKQDVVAQNVLSDFFA